MYEVEQKARVPHRSVRQYLDAEGVNPDSTAQQVDTYFDHPCKDFAETDEALRLREVTPEAGPSRTLLTYKGPRTESDTKTRREFEVEIESYSLASSIVEALEFTPVRTVRKKRTKYNYRDCIICLDDVEELGEFVEVEASPHLSDLAEAQTVVTDLMEMFGIDEQQLTTRSYLAMLLSDV